MTRPIEQRADQWVTLKEAAAMRGRHVDTVKNWCVAGAVRWWREPGGRLLVFVPDIMPPSELPPPRRRGGNGHGP